MNVTAKVTKAGGWWAVEVPEVAGVFTQVRRLDQVRDMVVDAVATLTGAKAADIAVEIVPVLPRATLAQITAARRTALKATTAQAEASEASEAARKAVRELRVRRGLSTRDVAALLGVTHQRVSQLGSGGDSEPISRPPVRSSGRSPRR